MTPPIPARYVFGPGLELRIRGDAGALRHFGAEYGEAATGDGGTSPAIEVDVERRRRRGPSQLAGGTSRIAGGHKTVRWQVAVGDPAAGPLTAQIRLGGAPRSFALSLVQGYFVESLIAVAAARAGCVLLPAAAIAQDAGALVMLGASGTGKSSLSVRALASGCGVLGDDQILIDREANCRRFPRRMRFYSDLRLTAPAAWARLPAAARAGLQARRAARVLSRGLVAPSLPIAANLVGDPGGAGPLAARRFVLLDRAAGVATLGTRQVAPNDAAAYGLALLAAQRERFAAGLDDRWRSALDEVAAVERAILESAFACAPIDRLLIPRAWDAQQAINALAGALGTESRSGTD